MLTPPDTVLSIYPCTPSTLVLSHALVDVLSNEYHLSHRFELALHRLLAFAVRRLLSCERLREPFANLLVGYRLEFIV